MFLIFSPDSKQGQDRLSERKQPQQEAKRQLKQKQSKRPSSRLFTKIGATVGNIGEKELDNRLRNFKRCPI